MCLIDLGHTIEDGMPGFRMKSADGSLTEYTAWPGAALQPHHYLFAVPLKVKGAAVMPLRAFGMLD